MISCKIASYAGSVFIAGVAIIGTIHAGLCDSLAVGSRRTSLITEIVTSQKIARRATCTISGRQASSTV